MAWRATIRAGLRLWVLSMIAAALALVPSPCSPIEPGAGLLQAPTSGESAVQCAALTAKQNSSECARVEEEEEEELSLSARAWGCWLSETPSLRLDQSGYSSCLGFG
jgi:hypothetical protein